MDNFGEPGRVYDAGVGSYDYGEDQTSMPFPEGNFTVAATPEDDDDLSGGIGFGTVISVDESDGLGLPMDETSNTEERNWVVVGVLIALIIVLWMILGCMLCVPLTRCIRRRMPVSKKRINRRYETIEGWLITKTVKSHDDGCEKIQKKYPPKSASSGDIEDQNNAMKHTESYDTADTTLVVADDNLFSDQDERECPICMEQFEEGDVVSWSSYEACSHTYHHQCIKEWLLRHNNCPFCREIFLPVDNVHTKITMKVFKELSDLRARRAEKTYYCIQDGLVTLADKCYSTACARKTSSSSNFTTTQPSILRKCAHISRSTDAVQLKEKLKAGVTKADLKKLRGNRCDKICYDDGPVRDIIQDQEMPSNGDNVVIQSNTSLAVPLGGGTDDDGPRILGEPADGASLDREDSSLTVSSHGRASSIDFESGALESPTRKDNSVFDCPISPIDTVCETDDEIDDSDGATDNEETNSHATIEQPCNDILVEETDKDKPSEIQSEESDRPKRGEKGDSGDNPEKALPTTTDSSCAQNSSKDTVTITSSEDTAERDKVLHENVIEEKTRSRNFDDSRHSTMQESAAHEPFPEKEAKEEGSTFRQEDLIDGHLKEEAQGSSSEDEQITLEADEEIAAQSICIDDVSHTNATSDAYNNVYDEPELSQRTLPLLPSF